MIKMANIFNNFTKYETLYTMIMTMNSSIFGAFAICQAQILKHFMYEILCMTFNEF